MALTDGNGNDMIMPVQPLYGGGNNNGGFGWGGDWGWIILLLLFAGGGWGNNWGGGFGGYGNMMLGYDFPWLLNGQNGINNNVSDGFRTAQLSDSLNSIQSGVQGLSTQLCNCCGDIQQSLCNGFAGVNATVNSGFANAESSANARQMANMQQAFNAQTAVTAGLNGLSSQFADCCCENRLGIADLKYTVATENCADRAALNDGVRDIIANQTAGVQKILDTLCQDKIDAKNDEIAQLRSQLSFANLQASQTAQNQAVIDGIYNRLDTCPVGTTPVYGRTPIFTCNQGCGCGCGNSF